MWRKYYHRMIILSLLLVPLLSFAQDNSAILEAITGFEHEVKRLIAAEKKQRTAEIKSLRNQIARLGGKEDAGPAAIAQEQYIDLLARIKELASEVSVLQSANGAAYLPASSSSRRSLLPIQRCVSRRQPRDRHPERGTRNVIHLNPVAKCHALRIAAVLATDTNL